MKERNKLYNVEFMEYSANGSTVKDSEGTYLDTNDLIIIDDDIEFIRKFGNGIRQLTYVGKLFERA